MLASLLTEQRVVLFSSDWSRLTLVSEALLLFLHPLSWQHPYVPVLSCQMLDFVMAPTAYLMGCHLQHYEEVAAVRLDWAGLCSNAPHCYSLVLYSSLLCSYCTVFLSVLLCWALLYSAATVRGLSAASWMR